MTAPNTGSCEQASSLKRKLANDLDQLALSLIRVFDLEFSEQVAHLSVPLLRWLDFRLRYIDPIPRRIVASHKFPKSLSTPVESALLILEQRLRNGEDVNPYQSKTLIRFHDTSSGKRAKRTDLLWAHWGIHHLHLTDIPLPDSASGFSARRCSNGETWLLFCLFVGDAVGFIDVRRHDENGLFSDDDLIRTVHDSWPQYMERFRLKGIMPPSTSPTGHDVATSRRGGVHTPICIGQNVYMGPGMGITTASTPTSASICLDRAYDAIDQLAELAIEPDGQLQTVLASNGTKSPQFDLCVTPKGLALLEVNCRIAFTFPKVEAVAQLEYWVAPPWARMRLPVAADERSSDVPS